MKASSSMSMCPPNMIVIDVSIDKLDARDAAEAVIVARRTGNPLAIVTAVHGAVVGRRVLFGAGGERRGTFGTPTLDAAALDLADATLASGTAEFREVGDAFLFCEAVLPADQLMIVGAGHIAVPLAQLGVLLGFQVTVLDDREEFATGERFPEQARVLRVDFADPFADFEFNNRTFVVLVTRAHRYDFDCLRLLLAREDRPFYLGMIGSRRRVRAAFQALIDDGVTTEQLAAVHAPVGLDIGAETPAEIAVSIAAELIRERTRASGTETAGTETLGAQERVLERFFSQKLHG